MKRLLVLTVTGIFSLILSICSAATDKAFVIPVETEIDLGAAHHFRTAMEEARTNGADIIIVKLNTYGGALDAADSIRTSLMRCPIPTAAFVDLNAASAGALIALACDSVFMAPGSSMGSATVVNGSGEPMPQKYQSYMSTMMRATAEHHGRKIVGDSTVWRRNPAIAEAMVNPDVSVSLTSQQAVDDGFADGIATDIPEVLEALGMPDAEITTYRSSLTDDLLGFLSGAGIRAILVMLILGGIYMEMHTPGLGFAAAVAVVASVLYFLPMLVAGSMPFWVPAAFIIGVILIALEVFVIPGFGVCGITGMIAVAVALIGAMTSSDSITGFDIGALGKALAVFFAGLIAATGVVWWLTSIHGPKCFRRHSELMTELKVSDGFIGVDMSPRKYIGQEAVAATDMRPAGKIKIGEHVFDAVSTGDYIARGHKVRVVRYENAQLYVTEI